MSSDEQTPTLERRYVELRELLLERENAALDGRLETDFGVSAEAFRRWRSERQTEMDALQREVSHHR